MESKGNELPKDKASEVERLCARINRLGREVDVYLGVYPGRSRLRNRDEVVVTMKEIDSMVAQVNAIFDEHRKSPT